MRLTDEQTAQLVDMGFQVYKRLYCVYHYPTPDRGWSTQALRIDADKESDKWHARINSSAVKGAFDCPIAAAVWLILEAENAVH